MVLALEILKEGVFLLERIGIPLGRGCVGDWETGGEQLIAKPLNHYPPFTIHHPPIK
jgi:hypothetical protein